MTIEATPWNNPYQAQVEAYQNAEAQKRAAAPKKDINVFASLDKNKSSSVDVFESGITESDFKAGGLEISLVDKAKQIFKNLIKTIQEHKYDSKVQVTDMGTGDEVDLDSLQQQKAAKAKIDEAVEIWKQAQITTLSSNAISRAKGDSQAERSIITDWSPASRVNLGEEWRGNRYTDEGLADLKEAVSTMEQPSDLLEYYLVQHSAELQGKTSVSDYDEQLMTDFVQKNPSIIRDGQIASNAKLDKLDFPSTEALKSYMKDSTPVERISDGEAQVIGKEIFSIADDRGGDTSAKGMRDYIELNINADNVAEVWNNYEAAQVGNGCAETDSSIIDSFTSEWLSESGEGGGRDHAYQATMHIINSLKTRAASLPEDKKGADSDVGKALAEINNKIEAAQYKDWIKGDDLTADTGDGDHALKKLFEDPIATLVDAILDAEQGEVTETHEMAEAPSNGEPVVAEEVIEEEIEVIEEQV